MKYLNKIFIKRPNYVYDMLILAVLTNSVQFGFRKRESRCLLGVRRCRPKCA